MKTGISKTETLIKNKLEQQGSRQTAAWLVDYFLKKYSDGALTSDELSDTATYANGLDSIEECFDDQDFAGATNIAKDTAVEMLEEEGFNFEDSIV